MNQDITQKTYKKLCFEVANSNLSFCVIDLISNKIITHKSYSIKENNVVEEELWKIFVENPILEDKYDDVVVLHNSNLNTFVPSSLFDPNYLGSYLQYNSKVFETDYFAYDYLDTYDLNNVFIPYTNINNYLLDHYDTFDYKNCNSIFVKKALDFSKNNDAKQVWVHFQNDRFEIVVTKNKHLLLFNTFIYKTLEDFIYYLLFTYEQLQLNPEIVPVQFVGDISEESDSFKIAYKYIRNCSLLDVSQLKTAFNVEEKRPIKALYFISLMRIISGKYKGRRLQAPKNLPVRPTTDMAKEALFNILNNHFNFGDLKILDLFSGTGNIAYEFASRGATPLVAVDADMGCVNFIRKISTEFDFDITPIKSDVFAFLQKHKGSYDIIFADPPYHLDQKDFEKIPTLIFENEILDEEGMLIIEHSKDTKLEHLDNFSFARTYGGTTFTFFELVSDEDESDAIVDDDDDEDDESESE